MYTFIVILILVVCVLLALVVLVQNSKGGGLAANFSAPTQVLGARQSADFIEKATWWLAGILIALSLLATALIPRPTNNGAATTEVAAVEDYSPVQQNAANTATPVAE